MKRLGLSGLLMVAALVGLGAWEPEEGRELLGRPAPEWRGIDWIQGGPLTLTGLRGKVVLLRFWLMDCPYCRRSAPALRTWLSKYRDEGLVVVGLHHPKSEAAHDRRAVAAGARELGFEFPIGHDDAWTTVRAYGVGRQFKKFTSVSFVIDRAGVIRFVHDGGEYHRDDSPENKGADRDSDGPGHKECAAAYEALEEAIQSALAHR